MQKCQIEVICNEILKELRKIALQTIQLKQLQIAIVLSMNFRHISLVWPPKKLP